MLIGCHDNRFPNLLSRDVAEGKKASSASEETSLASLTGDSSLARAERSTGAKDDRSAVEKFFFPDKEDLPDDFEMPIWDHLEELRERVLISGLAAAAAILLCFCFSKDLVVFLEAPVISKGVRFLQLSPGEFFFTTIKVWRSRRAGVLHRRVHILVS